MDACTDRRASTPPVSAAAGRRLARRGRGARVRDECAGPAGGATRPPGPSRARPGDRPCGTAATWTAADPPAAQPALRREAGDAPTAAAARLTVAFLLAERGRARHALDEPTGWWTRSTTCRGRKPAPRWPSAAGCCSTWAATARRLDHYREALPVLRAADDAFWVRRVIWNRGLAHAFRHEFAPARRGLRLAERLAQEQSLPLEVGFMANLAFVLGLRGETAAAFACSPTPRSSASASRTTAWASCWSTRPISCSRCGWSARRARRRNRPSRSSPAAAAT